MYSYIFDVSLILDKGDMSKDDPLILNEDEDQYDLFKFPINDPLETFHLKNYCLMLTFGNDRDVIP
jgi:hypothetical protein